MHKLRILVVDDEPQIHRFLGPALNAAGYEPARADNGRQALAEIARRPPDAVVLDLGLPDIDGQEVLRKAREFYDGPVVILSARDREMEKIEALDSGADDYVEKPFRVGELLARLRVIIRRHARQTDASPAIVQSGDLTIDIPRRLVSRAGEPVHLSPKEYELLIKLAEADGKVLTHKELLISLWGPAHGQDMQYLRVFIGQLRQKIEADPSAPKLIRTLPGIGYRLMVDEAIRHSGA
ncbi:response regulator transcription factor [Phenylobacterium sp.]|uniref:response regulator n=1 Tax=Phenylobacterium sp. TaxID=1871053 RepID=UPI00120EBFF5|nr:response regulator transcription factor [Phenylobacterium sp.]THD55038.1 MAG: response regulator transcription factor [Phenylobacterium sp.]